MQANNGTQMDINTVSEKNLFLAKEEEDKVDLILSPLQGPDKMVWFKNINELNNILITTRTTGPVEPKTEDLIMNELSDLIYNIGCCS